MSNPLPEKPLIINDSNSNRIFCPVCRTEILPGEPVCWICYGGSSSGNSNSRGDSSHVGGLVSSILAGLAISLGSVALGIIIAFIALMAFITSVLEELNSCCSGTAVLMVGIGWSCVEIIQAVLSCFF